MCLGSYSAANNIRALAQICLSRHTCMHAHLHSSQLLQDLTDLGGQMFPSLLENKEEENFYSVSYKMHCLQCTTKVTESFF